LLTLQLAVWAVILVSVFLLTTGVFIRLLLLIFSESPLSGSLSSFSLVKYLF